MTPLWQAADDGLAATAQRLLLGGGGGPGGVEVDTARKNDGSAPLFQATTQGFVEMERVLLERGADTKKLSSDMQV